MTDMHIVSIVGARPNFIKIAALDNEIRNHPNIKHTLIHTGQHYDEALSNSFFNILNTQVSQFELSPKKCWKYLISDS